MNCVDPEPRQKEANLIVRKEGDDRTVAVKYRYAIDPAPVSPDT